MKLFVNIKHIIMENLKLKSTVKSLTVLGAILILGLTSCAQGNTNDELAQDPKKPSMDIHQATFMGNTKAIQEHINAKSDLNKKDAYGSTPLTIAATFDKTDVALLLIKGGADINALSADGSTPLHTASFFGRTEMVKALLDAGADVTIRNNYGSTALESVSASFADVKMIYDQLSKDLGPLGLKLDYGRLEKVRPLIAEMISAKTK
jgi:hypothetical protein